MTHAVWASSFAAFALACERGATRKKDGDREDVNEIRARWHIVTSIAARYGWPPGMTEEKLRAMVPERYRQNL